MVRCLPLGAVVMAFVLHGQEAPQPQPEKLSFDVASIKPNRSGPQGESRSNFPLGPGNVYVPNGGTFSATNYPFQTYLRFAYRMMGNEIREVLPQLPEWAITEGFDILAKSE